MPDPNQQQLPIQALNKPIICSPYEEPDKYWFYDKEGNATQVPSRRPASYWYKTQRTGTGVQGQLFAEEERDDLPMVNALREDVRYWREVKKYEGATPTTKKLLNYWASKDRPRRLFFCQREAVETIIYLREILESRKVPHNWRRLKLSFEDYSLLKDGEKPSFVTDQELRVFPSLIDQPLDTDLPGLMRLGCKMATGSGKTVVMSMLIAWAFCNRGANPGDQRFPNATLVVCPNLTIRERLQVLRPELAGNYYEDFDLVPSQLLPELRKGKVLVTNWHRFAPASEHSEGGKTYNVVEKGEESPDAFAQRVLGEIYERAPIMVLNDEAHHAYRPAPVQGSLSADEKADREEATIWIDGLDKINKACGVKFAVDLSATPFYLKGSGYIEGSPFSWLVSDFGLVDAIESGITKIPRIPVSDTTGRPDPKFFALWKHINENLQPGERLPGGKPKPDAVWREAQDALTTLASQWKERFDYYLQASNSQEKVPPVMIIVGDNTNIAEAFFRNISGEDQIEIEENGKTKKITTYGNGQIFPDCLSNTENRLATLRIDSKLLAEAESDDPNKNKKDAAEDLRQIVDTVGKYGQPGEQVRCVVSVQMLTEGWDANNVTQILGLRAFGSQLLCEQVVGRGLRRMNYTPDPETGLLTEEYVDVYGIPFSLIPFKGRKTTQSAPEDKPKQHVHALPERKGFEMRFPVVEGFAFALKQNLIKADLENTEKLVLQPDQTPTAVFVKPQVGYQFGHGGLGGSFETVTATREAFYASTHLQTIKFEIARRIVWALTESVGTGEPKMRFHSRHQLFPQVFGFVNQFVNKKIDFRGCDEREIGLEIYTRQVVERLLNAIEPDSIQGEPPLLPILNRYKPIGSTLQVSFFTTRPCFQTGKSHINQVVSDTRSWEQSAAFHLENSDKVICYARNDHLELVIPYDFLGASHSYTPDFIVRLSNGSNLILEVKGYETDQDRAKHQAAQRWISAVNNWGQLGKWHFYVCHDPQVLEKELEYYFSN